MGFFSIAPTRLAWRIVLAAGVILVGALAVVVVSLTQMAGEVNRTEETLTARSAEAAVNAVLRRMGDSNHDYAGWDDAVRKLYGTVDPSFVSENFQTATESPIFFDTAYLIDENGHAVFGYHNGELTTISAGEAFGPALAKMIDELPSDGRAYDVRTGLVGGEWGPAAIAVGPIVPVSADFKDPPLRSRFLVIAKAFDDDAIKRMGEDFLIDGLRFEDRTNGARKIDLADPTGRVIGALTRAPPRLGTEAHSRVNPLVLAMLGLLGVAVALLIAVAIAGLKEIQRRAAQARYEATHDQLTGLANRVTLVRTLDEAIANKRSGGPSIAVVYLDLDGFKEVNDAYGHESGDLLLRRVANAFQGVCGERLLTRIGGDEFAALVPGDNALKMAGDLGRKLIDSLGEPFDIAGRVVVVGASVGVAAADVENPTAEELLRRADVAMYQAKRQGPNRMFVYEASIDTIRHERLEIGSDLRAALQSDDLDLTYQPLVSVATREVVGAEALLRWTRPGFGPVPAAVFVPIAEEVGLIDELGAWTFRRACREALGWGDVRLSINVSPAQFRNPDFEAVVADILAETGFPPERLELDVADAFIVIHRTPARRLIEAIRGLGVAIALDDFGIAYSSVGYLTRFTFDRLTVKKTMIAGIVTDRRVQERVHAAIAFAKTHGLKVTAEGVETEEEAAMLSLAGCDELQGFFFAKPASALDFAIFLTPASSSQLDVRVADSA